MVWIGAAGCPTPPPRPWAKTPDVETRQIAIAKSDVVLMAGILVHGGWRLEAGGWERNGGSKNPETNLQLIASDLWQDLPRVHQVVRIEGLFDGAHHVERLQAVLRLEEPDLADADAVFARARPAHRLGALHEPIGHAVRLGDVLGLVR